MLVFGDAVRKVRVASEIDELRCANRLLPGTPAGLARHEILTGLFIRASELAQGIVDAEFQEVKEDRLTAAGQITSRLLRQIGIALQGSWRCGWKGGAVNLDQILLELERASRNNFVSCSAQEGYAFYALYPEAYLAAASALAGEAPAVIGIRSIGLGLGALVALAAKGSLFLSVRPVGHPFDRKLSLASKTKMLLARHSAGVFAVVDEGPGLSGSSFRGVAQALEKLGARKKRIHFFPSHTGEPGGEAGPQTRAWWAAAPRHTASFESLILHRLPEWCADITGRAITPLEDVSGGNWRRHSPQQADKALVQPMRERRKYLLRSRQGVFLLRFAGLGDYGLRTYARARALAAANLSPEVLGLRYGFMVERWLENVAPLQIYEEREGLIGHLARYLAFRSHHLPASTQSGAPLEKLVDMLIENAKDALDFELSRAEWRSRAKALSQRVFRVQTDNKLHCWEWLRGSDGRIVKTDAYDHCAGHDLIGCQDIAWDIAGAATEFRLSCSEVRQLCARLRQLGVVADIDLLSFLWPCYVAFQLGATYQFLSQLDFEDKERAISEARRYELELRRVIAQQ